MHATLPLALVGKDLWTGIPIIEKVIRTVGIYLGLVIMLRFAGKRDLAQLNSFDLVVLLLLSNIVQNAVIGNDTSLSGGLLGAAVILVTNGIVVGCSASRIAPPASSRANPASSWPMEPSTPVP